MRVGEAREKSSPNGRASTGPTSSDIERGTRNVSLSTSSAWPRPCPEALRVVPGRRCRGPSCRRRGRPPAGPRGGSPPGPVRDRSESAHGRFGHRFPHRFPARTLRETASRLTPNHNGPARGMPSIGPEVPGTRRSPAGGHDRPGPSNGIAARGWTSFSPTRADDCAKLAIVDTRHPPIGPRPDGGVLRSRSSRPGSGTTAAAWCRNGRRSRPAGEAVAVTACERGRETRGPARHGPAPDLRDARSEPGGVSHKDCKPQGAGDLTPGTTNVFWTVSFWKPSTSGKRCRPGPARRRPPRPRSRTRAGRDPAAVAGRRRRRRTSAPRARSAIGTPSIADVSRIFDRPTKA